MGITGKNRPRSYPDGRVTTVDIEDLTGVGRSTLYNWRKTKPALYQALELAVRATRARELLS